MEEIRVSAKFSSRNHPVSDNTGNIEANFVDNPEFGVF
jgi:hypothetical protein